MRARFFFAPWAVFLLFLSLTPVLPPVLASVLPQDSAPVQLPFSRPHVLLGPHLELFEDPTQQLGIEEVRRQDFRPSQEDIPNFGITHSAHWARFSLHNPNREMQERILEVAHPNIDRIYFFRPEESGYRVTETGRAYVFAKREIRHRNFAFRLRLPPQSTQTYYLRLQSSASFYLNLNVYDPTAFAAKERDAQFGFGFYYGLIFVMFFYNLVLWISTRDKNYVYYVLTLLFLHGLFQLAFNGLGYEYLWPWAVWWNTHCLGLFLGWSVFFSVHFSQSFLNTREHNPKLHPWMNALKWLGFALGCANLAPDGSFLSELSITWNIRVALVAVVGIWAVALLNRLRGQHAAHYFLIAWSSLLLGALITGFTSLGFLPSSFWTHHALQLGTGLEVILISLALGDRLRRAQEEILEAQEDRLWQERRAKQAQERLVERLQKLDRLKDDFIANISHELKTPLNGIIGISDSMLDGATGEMSTLQRQNLELVMSSGRRLFHLVNDLLDFSQLKHREIRLNTRPVWLREISEVVLKLSQPLVGTRTIELVNAVPADLPPILADEDRLQQILHNLVSNAIKFTDAGEVKISAEATRQFIEITVSDTGEGISPHDHKRIFSSFEQLDESLTRQHSGSGLGLAITRQLVELHGGQIRVESERGQGAKFHFLMPIATEEQGRADAAAPAETPMVLTAPLPQLELAESAGTVPEQQAVEIPREQADANTFHILIVDDEPINLQVLVNMLSLQKYTLTRAQSGAEALTLIRKQSFDLVLLDVMMPHMSGYEVCETIRQQYPANELPVVFLTARNQIGDVVQGFDTGANDYLTKPVSKNELLARIRTHIHLSKLNLSYARFVPDEFLRFLGRESILDVQLGDQVQRTMSVMFSDIRNFTSLSESLTPKQNFDFINEYLSRISPIIRIHQGFIDKYIGDGVMALFPHEAQDALDASVEMLTELRSFNLERRDQNFRPIEIGIGLHTGMLMLGTIGESERMEGTVISDAVNTAARMEGLTKLYGACLIISGQTREQLQDPEKYPLRNLGQVRVKGREQVVEIFEVLIDDDTPSSMLKLKSMEDFEAGVQAYIERDLERAQSRFQAVLELHNEDLAAHYYLERCERFLQQGIPEDISPRFV